MTPTGVSSTVPRCRPWLGASSWFEHLTDTALVAPDGSVAFYGTATRRLPIDLATGTELSETTAVRPDPLRAVAPGGRIVAVMDAANRAGGIEIDGVRRAVPGAMLGAQWTPDGTTLVTLTRAADDTLTLGTIDASGAFRAVAGGLDGDVFPAQFAVTPDGRGVLMSLVGPETPAPAQRHLPLADRDLDLWRVDLASGEATPVVRQPGDDIAPQIVHGRLLWTHAEVATSVVVLPVDGGEPRPVASPGELPYWRPDGRQIGFTVGGWRLRDMALPLDAYVVDVDAAARPVGAPRPFISGFHEDFSPVWSPDGRWVAYHSHRSPTPVTSYSGAGSTDDIWIRPAGGDAASERRLTDFGHEAGNGDWSPDGRAHAFSTYDDASPTAPQGWIVSVDPASGRSTGKTKLRLPRGASTVETLAWSPDGRTIAIESTAGEGRHAIWLVPPRGGAGRRLIEYPVATFGGVDWTPDGKRLVYGALVDGRMQLHAIDVATGATRQLTRGDASTFLPQVSPDGRVVAATAIVHVRRILQQPWR